MIHLLKEDTIQKIAAGEVIERPVSVVKELVENSIDAGSTAITVEIRAGGKELIRVADNGSGIAPGDFETAFLRHATSKIDDFEDLYRVHSLGFRGEALASIVAVARVIARTKTEKEELGTELRYEDSRVIAKSPVAMSEGTEILVEDLFYNIPVRRGFMKSDVVEAQRISQLLYSLAIGNPRISFTFVRDDRRIFRTRGNGSTEDDLLVLFGPSYHDAIIGMSAETDRYRIAGFIGDNTFFRGNRQMQFLFANGRFVEDEDVRDVIESCYRSVIPNGRFPAFQIFVETDPGNIDINIHPNKQKIRFLEKQELLEAMRSAVERALSSNRALPGFAPEPAKKEKPDFSSEDTYRRVLESYREATSLRETRPSSGAVRFDDLKRTLESSLGASSGKNEEEEAAEREPAELESEADFVDIEMIEDELDSPGEENPEDELDAVCAEIGETEDFKDFEAPEILTFVDREKTDSELPDEEELRYVGALFKTYPIFESADGSYALILDQHAAHERVNYERFTKQFRAREIRSQQLLPPIRVRLTLTQEDRLAERREVLEASGFEYSEMGPQEIALRSVPALFEGPENERLFLDLLDLEIPSIDALDAVVDRLATKACKASVKQGDRLSELEARALYRELRACAYPLTCPHGRPTVVRWTKSDAEKLFFRIK